MNKYKIEYPCPDKSKVSNAADEIFEHLHLAYRHGGEKRFMDAKLAIFSMGDRNLATLSRSKITTQLILHARSLSLDILLWHQALAQSRALDN